MSQHDSGPVSKDRPLALRIALGIAGGGLALLAAACGSDAQAPATQVTNPGPGSTPFGSSAPVNPGMTPSQGGDVRVPSAGPSARRRVLGGTPRSSNIYMDPNIAGDPGISAVGQGQATADFDPKNDHPAVKGRIRVTSIQNAVGKFGGAVPEGVDPKSCVIYGEIVAKPGANLGDPDRPYLTVAGRPIDDPTSGYAPTPIEANGGRTAVYRFTPAFAQGTVSVERVWESGEGARVGDMRITQIGAGMIKPDLWNAPKAAAQANSTGEERSVPPEVCVIEGQGATTQTSSYRNGEATPAPVAPDAQAVGLPTGRGRSISLVD